MWLDELLPGRSAAVDPRGGTRLSWVMSCSVCGAGSCTRMRLVPRGTTGHAGCSTSTPAERMRSATRLTCSTRTGTMVCRPGITSKPAISSRNSWMLEESWARAAVASSRTRWASRPSHEQRDQLEPIADRRRPAPGPSCSLLERQGRNCSEATIGSRSAIERTSAQLRALAHAVRRKSRLRKAQVSPDRSSPGPRLARPVRRRGPGWPPECDSPRPAWPGCARCGPAPWTR